jgi:DNA-binding LacI/PurR family transcriptional regulator
MDVQDLDRAGIPVVLLDRCILPFPNRSQYDLVGIDNRRAGYLAAEHLLKLCCGNVAFLAISGAAPTVEARIAGYREALGAYGVPETGNVQRLDNISELSVAEALCASGSDVFVCANDRIAGRFMHAPETLGRRVPEDIRPPAMPRNWRCCDRDYAYAS